MKRREGGICRKGNDVGLGKETRKTGDGWRSKGVKSVRSQWRKMSSVKKGGEREDGRKISQGEM